MVVSCGEEVALIAVEADLPSRGRTACSPTQACAGATGYGSEFDGRRDRGVVGLHGERVVIRRACEDAMVHAVDA